MSKRSAFTLIELLVVIAIIAILAAILFPVFAQARDKARQAVDISNQKQILLAIMMYTQDYDENLPLGKVGKVHWDGNINTDAEGDGINDEVNPYVKAGNPWGPEYKSSVWADPSDSYRRDDCDGAPGIGVGYDISEGFTNYSPLRPTRGFGVFNFHSDGEDGPSQTLAGVAKPAGTIIMFPWWNPQNYARFYAITRYNMGDLTYFGVYPNALSIGDLCGDGYTWLFSIGAHNGISDWGYLDGHVKSMPASALWNENPAACSAPGSCIWNGQAPNKMAWSEQYNTN